MSLAGIAERSGVKAAFDANILKQVATEIENVKAEYGGVVSEESIDLVAGEQLQRLAGSKVPQFVSLFVGRFTRERLQELTGLRPPGRLNLLSRRMTSPSEGGRHASMAAD